MWISRLHFLFQLNKTYNHEYRDYSYEIRQKTHHQFRDVISREKERKEQYKYDDKNQRYHKNQKKINTRKDT